MIDRSLVKRMLKKWAKEFDLLDKKVTIVITQDKGTRWRRGKVYVKEVDFYGETLPRTDTSVVKEVNDFLIIITEKHSEKELEDTIKHELLHVKLWNKNLPEKEEHKLIRKMIRETNEKLN